ncbi:M48 family metalloprotease [Luteolibacter pohnpeiensis]|uniref:M48 family metalloprotease n=1 Tax=Luteolibacter pohnpeiensis TaxID=454153 RepID=A0A934S2M5_9BACT|nr:M48 family metalloprotease [Luteolibacter pohnpeiensis]MBK1881306.1 M48 family metalloprotease [Luteolibacter pohnpeiensis]
MSRSLTALPQHQMMVDWLRTYEPEVWKWQAEAERTDQNLDEVRLSLLRDTYRLTAEEHPELFQEIAAAQEALGLADIVVNAYQSEGESVANAAICYVSGEIHLLFSGPILTLLAPEELRGVVGHELAHYRLWHMEGGVYFLADRILHQSAIHPNGKSSHRQSARLWSLATELFSDRGSYLATGNLEISVASLVKAVTGLSKVSGKSYLSQAEEIFAKSKPKISQLTHPETFIRARALQLWVEDSPDCDEAIDRMLDQSEELESLDLIRQLKLVRITRSFLKFHLSPDWFRSDEVLAHARLYFPDFDLEQNDDDASLIQNLGSLSKAEREYLCNVMLDFCAVDSDLEELPLASGIEQARAMECLGYFEKIATKELKVKPKVMKNLKETAAQVLAKIGKEKP